MSFTPFLEIPQFMTPGSRTCCGRAVRLPDPVVQGMYQRGWKFYTNVFPDCARLMCSWDTTAEDVDAFAADLAEVTVHHG